MRDLNLYEELQKELKTAKENNDEFFIKNFKNILSRVDDLKDSIGKNLTNEDILTILKDIYDDINQKITDGQYSNSKYSKEIKKLMNTLKEYFVATGYDYNNYNPEQLSDGRSVEEVNKAIDNKIEALCDKNPIAYFLSVIGKFIIAFVILTGIITLLSVKDFTFWMVILYWIFGVINGLIFLGFSEVIKLLHDIRRKLYK